MQISPENLKAGHMLNGKEVFVSVPMLDGSVQIVFTDGTIINTTVDDLVVVEQERADDGKFAPIDFANETRAASWPYPAEVPRPDDEVNANG